MQQQVITGMSVSAAYFHRTYRDLEILDRGQISNADYTSFTLPMPNFSNDPTLTGVLDPNEIIPVYNLSTAKRSVFSASQVDFNTTGAIGGVPNQSWYNGVEMSVSARFARSTIFGGYTIERNVTRFCDFNDDPNGLTTSDMYEGNTVSNGGRFCDQSQFGMPWRQEFKLSGTVVPLPSPSRCP